MIFLYSTLKELKIGMALLQKTQIKYFTNTFISDDINKIDSIIKNDETSQLSGETLSIVATNNEIENIHIAAFINRKYSTKTNVTNIVRTQTYDVLPNNILSDILGQDNFIILPTLTWAKIDFELIMQQNAEK